MKKRKLQPITAQFLSFEIGFFMLLRLLARKVFLLRPSVVIWLLARERVHIKDVTVASEKMIRQLGIGPHMGTLKPHTVKDARPGR